MRVTKKPRSGTVDIGGWCSVPRIVGPSVKMLISWRRVREQGVGAG